MVIAKIRANCKCKPLRLILGPHNDDGCPLADVTADTAWYTVTRIGLPKREGGKGVAWGCSCNQGGYPKNNDPEETGPDKQRLTCRHLRALFAGNIVEVEDRASATGGTLKNGGYYAILTPDGVDLLKPTWAERALKEAGEAR